MSYLRFNLGRPRGFMLCDNNFGKIRFQVIFSAEKAGRWEQVFLRSLEITSTIQLLLRFLLLSPSPSSVVYLSLHSSAPYFWG